MVIHRPGCSWHLLRHLLVLALLAGATVAHAGARPAGATHRPRGAGVSLRFAQSGIVYATVYASKPGAEGATLAQPLISGLGCRLESLLFTYSNDRYAGFSCQAGMNRSALHVDGEFDLSRTLAALAERGEPAVQLTVSYPAGPVAAALNGRVQPGTKYGAFFHAVLPTTAPALLHLEYGYTGGRIRAVVVASLAVFLLPIVLMVVVTRRVLGNTTRPVPELWFGYARLLQWTILGGFLGWCTAAQLLGVDKIAQFAMAWLDPRAITAPVWLLVYFVPAALLAGILMRMSQPVQARLLGARWTRAELFVQGIFAQAVFLIPLFILIGAAQCLITGFYRAGGLLIVGGFFCWQLFVLKAQDVLDLKPHAISVGSLRDRAFALAEKAGVKLRGLYVLPMRKGRMVNAFARSGNSILLTDLLLEQMTSREVDAILAHEIGHLQLGHTRRLGLIMVLPIFLGTLLMLFLNEFVPGVPLLALLPPLIFAVIVTSFLARRKWERAADLASVSLTGDAEAAVAALAKLARLNKVPMSWGRWTERTITHPSMAARIEAIAAHAGIAPERVAELAAGDAGNEHYDASASAEERKLFSTTFKRQVQFRLGWTLLGACTIPAAVLARVLPVLNLDAIPLGLILLAGAAGCLVVLLAVLNYGSVRGMRRLREPLAARLREEAVRVNEWHGTYLAFVPGETHRLYEGFWNWDVGFAFLTRDRLCYAGEQARFGVKREEILSIACISGPPSWFGLRTVVVRWRRADGVAGSFGFRAAGAPSLLSMAEQTKRFADALSAWHNTGDGPLAAAPETLLALPAAVPLAVSSVEPRAIFDLRGVTGRMIIGAFTAALVSLALGVKFIVLSEESGFRYGPAWWAAGAGALFVLVQSLPVLRYRERKSPQAARAAGQRG